MSALRQQDLQPLFPLTPLIATHYRLWLSTCFTSDQVEPLPIRRQQDYENRNSIHTRTRIFYVS